MNNLIYQKELISVIMSIYNETIEEIKLAIKSILNQSYSNLELIVIVDNPKYKDAIIFLKKIQEQDDRIKFICNKNNIGLAMSMNKAIEISEGKYIARMDADDISKNNRLELEYNYLINNDYDLVCCNYENIDEEGNIIKKNSTYFDDSQMNNLIYTTNIIHHPTVLMKKISVVSVGGYRDFPCAQDYDLWLRMKEKGSRFGMLKDVLFSYRIRKNSITSSKTFLQSITLNYILQLFKERIDTQKDSYSKDNYFLYVDMCEKKYQKYKENINKIQKIQKKESKNKIVNMTKKVYLFLTSNFIRDNYLMKLRIKNKISNIKN